MSGEIITSGTRELYRLFSLPVPVVTADIDEIRVEIKPGMTDEELIDYLKDGVKIVYDSDKSNPRPS